MLVPELQASLCPLVCYITLYYRWSKLILSPLLGRATCPLPICHHSLL